LDGPRVSKLTAHFHIWVNYSLLETIPCNEKNAIHNTFNNMTHFDRKQDVQRLKKGIDWTMKMFILKEVEI